MKKTLSILTLFLFSPLCASLHEAIINDDYGSFKLLITSTGALNEQDVYTKETLLHRSVRLQRYDFISHLLKIWANTRMSDIFGETPLHAAAYNGDLRVTRLLLLRGANINAQNNRGYTPAHIAAAQGNITLLLFLINHSYYKALLSNEGKSALDIHLDVYKDDRPQLCLQQALTEKPFRARSHSI